MSEPTNPLFEEEKAFLERKKQEYERALRGDVALLKEQAGHAGRIAAVGAGLAGSIWLITKAFSSKSKRRADYRDYDDYDYGPDDYPTQHFGDYDPYDDSADRRPDRWRYADEDENQDDEAHGTVYHSDTDHYDNPRAHNDQHESDADSDYLAHSTSGHGFGEDPGQAAKQFESEAYGHLDSTLPFDDSRRLPESADFQESDDEATDAERRIPTPPARPQENLGAMLTRLARTSVGKVIVGQAFSFGLALAAKAIREKLEHDAAETPKNSDLADATGKNDGYAHGHPATPQPDADYPAADAAHF